MYTHRRRATRTRDSPPGSVVKQFRHQGSYCVRLVKVRLVKTREVRLSGPFRELNIGSYSRSGYKSFGSGPVVRGQKNKRPVNRGLLKNANQL